jgi:hypothetical protein
MEDYKVILYIVGGIIYFLLQFRKKAKNEEPIPVPKTNRPKLETIPQPEKQYKNVRSYIDEILEKELNIEKAPTTSLKPVRNLEKSGTDKMNQKARVKTTFKKAVSLEKNPNYRSKEMDRSGNHFAQFDIKKKSKHSFLETISTSKGIRNAFIASEVLKPKYF